MATSLVNSGRDGGTFLTKYFLVILFGFACLSLMLNSRFTHVGVHDISILENHLRDSVQSSTLKRNIDSAQNGQMVDDAVEQEPNGDSHDETDEDHKNEQGQQNEIIHKGLANPHSHRLAGLTCDKYGGPDEEAAQEMVYWEDIPSDAEWISPFHTKHRNGPTQYLTFEPDRGGWNNIR